MDMRGSAQALLRACGLTAGAACLLALMSSGAHAQEVTTYGYDALGCLASSSTSGGPNNGVATGTCFDAVGNRTQYVVATTGAACTTQASSMQAQTALAASAPAQAEAAATRQSSASLTLER